MFKEVFYNVSFTESYLSTRFQNSRIFYVVIFELSIGEIVPNSSNSIYIELFDVNLYP